MPFKSQAQRRKFAEMMVKGEISPQTFEEWNRETGSAKLPERVGKKSARKSAKKTSRKGAGVKKRATAKKTSRPKGKSTRSVRKR